MNGQCNQDQSHSLSPLIMAVLQPRYGNTHRHKRYQNPGSGFFEMKREFASFYEMLNELADIFTAMVFMRFLISHSFGINRL